MKLRALDALSAFMVVSSWSRQSRANGCAQANRQPRISVAGDWLIRCAGARSQRCAASAQAHCYERIGNISRAAFQPQSTAKELCRRRTTTVGAAAELRQLHPAERPVSQTQHSLFLLCAFASLRRRFRRQRRDWNNLSSPTPPRSPLASVPLRATPSSADRGSVAAARHWAPGVSGAMLLYPSATNACNA